MRSVLALLLTLASTVSFAQAVFEAKDEIKIPADTTEVEVGSAGLHCVIPVSAKPFERKISKNVAFDTKGKVTNQSLLSLQPWELLTLVRQMKFQGGQTLSDMLAAKGKSMPAVWPTTAALNDYLAKEFGLKFDASWTLSSVQLQSNATNTKLTMTCWEQMPVDLATLADQLATTGAKIAPSTEL